MWNSMGYVIGFAVALILVLSIVGMFLWFGATVIGLVLYGLTHFRELKSGWIPFRNRSGNSDIE